MKRDTILISLTFIVCTAALVWQSSMQHAESIQEIRATLSPINGFNFNPSPLQQLITNAIRSAKSEDLNHQDSMRQIQKELDTKLQEQIAFNAALARIPTDEPEPQRSEAARHLIEIEKQEKLKDPDSFESIMARATRGVKK